MLDFDAAESAVLRALIRNDARWLIIGGYAMQAHGSRRPPRDLDIWIEPSPDNDARVHAALDDVGYQGPTVDQLAQPGKKLTLERYTVDLVTSITGLSFTAAYNDACSRRRRSALCPYCPLMTRDGRRLELGDRRIVEISKHCKSDVALTSVSEQTMTERRLRWPLTRRVRPAIHYSAAKKLPSHRHAN